MPQCLVHIYDRLVAVNPDNDHIIGFTSIFKLLFLLLSILSICMFLQDARVDITHYNCGRLVSSAKSTAIGTLLFLDRKNNPDDDNLSMSRCVCLVIS